MIEAGRLFCDTCRNHIQFENPPTRVLIEFVKGGTDRHYCDSCFQKHYRNAGSSPSSDQSAKHAPPIESKEDCA